MAGALAELPDESSCSAIAIKDQTPWRMDYARFFSTPLTSSCSGLLKLSSRKRKISRGTWLLASDYASVFILSDCLATLVVLVGGKIYSKRKSNRLFLFEFVLIKKLAFALEEHFLANLNFSWPHVSCSPNSPHWGSRVIFASYKDGCGLIQKFALRFAEDSEAKKFLDAIKESSRDAIDISGKDDVDTQTTSGFENIAPNEHLYRTDEVSSHAAPDGFYRPATPVCSEELECSQTPNHALGFYPVGPSSLPPSFTSLLSECATDHLQGSAGVPENERVDMKENTPMVEESDLASQIRNFMVDASFHDMLSKVEKIMNELGEDLQL
ncbi:protein POOR HOMOLOGOUS SYNAPSIS 1-like [Aristolochia californica]|uniref:protein POOR HOMOLOGOUS SYNAPSIS 1-like n=1 Tax=Aristolochia californica TaxID=171875 RepID=UPI0035D7E5AE